MSGMFGSAASSSPELYAGMQVSTSLQGQVIPYVTGRTQVNFNLLWYGDFQAHGNASSSKGGGAPSSYSYTAAFIAALCLGPIQGIYTVYHDRSITSLTYENLSYALGATGQATWSGYPSGTPAGQAIPYSNLAYVATPNYNFGSSASMPNLLFEVEGSVPGYSDAHNMFDADISAVIVDYLTNPVTGAGFAGAIQSLTGNTNTFQAYCMALGLMVSNYENNQRAATDFMKEIMQIANSDLVLSCGTLRVVPYADTAVSGTTADGQNWSYTPDLTPIYIFTDSDYCPKEGEEPVKLNRKATSDTYNIVNLEYLDRSDYYNPSPASASNNWDISIRGPRCMSTITLHELTSATVAKTVAQLILNFQLYERNTYTFRVRADYWLLEPMDYIGINDSGLELTNQVCRITQIDEDEDNFLTLTVMEVPGTIRNTPQYNWTSAQGYFQNFDAAPGSVQAPAIFAMPPVAAAISDGITVGIAVAGQTSEAFWGGCNIYASVDGGNTYGWIGIVASNGPARYGALTANFPQVADPDTSSTLSVALANTTLQLSTAVTHADADDLQTLILVGSGGTAEVMSYGGGTLVSAGNYNLSYFRRGLYGSQPEAQTSGAQFVRLDSSIFQIAFDPGMAGQEIYFKFCSFNSVGRAPEELSAVTAYSYTIPAALPVSGINAWTVQGSNVGVNSTGTQIYKSGGASAWDSAAYSPQPFLNGCFIAWMAAGAAAAIQMAGLSTNPSSTASDTSLDLGLETNNGSIYIYQFGTAVNGGASFGSYALGDTFEVRYDGVTARFFRNGALLLGIRAAGLKLYPKVCLYSPTSVVSGLSYGPASAVNQPTGSLLNTYPWIIGTTGSQGNFSDVAGSGNPVSQIVQAGKGSAPLGPYGTSEAIWETQGTISAVNGGWSNNGDLYGIDPTKTYRSVVWIYWNGSGTGTPAFYHGCDTTYTDNLNGTPNTNPYFTNGLSLSASLSPGKWYLAVGIIHGAGYNGAASGLSGVYDPATGTLVAAGTDFVNIAGALYQTQRLFQYADTSSAGIVYFAKPRFEEVNGNEPTLQALMAPASALQGFVSTNKAVVTGTTVLKQGGAAAWDSCVYSVNGYISGHIAAKPIGTLHAMMGFSTNPALSSSYTNGNYCWYNQAGTWAIYEGGGGVGTYGAIAATDLVEITYDGSTITYLLNKVSMRTVSISGLSIYAFLPLNDPGSGWNLVDFGATDVSGVIDTSQLGNNAASQIASVSSATGFSASTNAASPTTVIGTSATVVCTGAPISIDISGTYQYKTGSVGTPSVTISVYKDGSLLSTSAEFQTGTLSVSSTSVPIPFALIASDTPTAGSHTYAIALTVTGATGVTNTEAQIIPSYIKVREYRK